MYIPFLYILRGEMHIYLFIHKFVDVMQVLIDFQLVYPSLNSLEDKNSAKIMWNKGLIMGGVEIDIARRSGI